MTDTTRLPWLAHVDDGSWWICTNDGQNRVAYVGHTSSPNAAGDARLIETACNAFDLMITALDGAACLLETIHDAKDSDDPWIVDLYAVVQAALKLARKDVAL